MKISNRLLVPAGISLLIAACGGSAGTTPGASHRSTLAYAECMHGHGVPNFPDPGPDGGIDKDKVIALGNSPQITRAQNACQHVMPTSGLGPEGTSPPPRTRFADLLAMARCLRGRGFPAFPDPSRSGGLSRQMVLAAGINVQQPALRRAADACTTVTHGAVSKAMVARFVAGQ